MGVASVAVMIGIHLPWFDFGSPATGYFSFSATSLRSWMYLPFLGALATVVYLVLKATVGDVRLPLPHRLVLVAVTGADLLLTAVCFAKKAVGVQWDIGAYVSIVAGGVALIGTLAPRRRFARPVAVSDDVETTELEAPLRRHPERDDRS